MHIWSIRSVILLLTFGDATTIDIWNVTFYILPSFLFNSEQFDQICLTFEWFWEYFVAYSWIGGNLHIWLKQIINNQYETRMNKCSFITNVLVCVDNFGNASLYMLLFHSTISDEFHGYELLVSIQIISHRKYVESITNKSGATNTFKWDC